MPGPSIVEWYNVTDLTIEFGVSRARVRNWIHRGLFGKHVVRVGKVRIPEKAVIRFICYHPAEYSLMDLDQAWLRALLFGEMLTGRRKRDGA